jgi:hypothetical protein
MEDIDFDQIISRLQALQLEQTTLLNELERRRVADRAGHPNRSPSNQEVVFAVGDRVLITNHVTKPTLFHTTWDQTVAQRATVTKVATKRINVTTDNRVRTWRDPKNLAPLVD